MSKKKDMSQAAGEIVANVVATKRIEEMTTEHRSTYNKVMDAIEDFEATLELEHSSLGNDTWSIIKGVLYQIARAAAFGTKKGLQLLYKFINHAKRWAKQADVAGRLTRAWSHLTTKNKEELPQAS